MDVKQRGILMVMAVLGLLIFIAGGMATGSISARPFEVTPVSRLDDGRPEFDAQFLYKTAMEDYDRMDYVGARGLANRLTYINPKFAGGFKLLAAISLREKNYRYAVDECQKALALDPTDVTTKLGLASAYRGLGKPKEAERIYRAVGDDPYAVEGHRKEADLQLQEMGFSPNPQTKPEAKP